eukprot:PITA_05517
MLVPEFDGNDYDYWCIKMLTFLIGKDLWEILESGYEEPTDWNSLTANERTTRKEARKKNAQALFHIQIALDKSLFPRISGAKTTKVAWETLQEAYQGSDQVKVVKLQTLKREFENLKMQEAESISDYCVRVKDVVNKMATLGEAVSNEVLIKKVLRSLTHRCNHVAIIMEESKDLTKLQFDELVGSLMSHKERLKETFEAIEKSFSSKLQITNNEDVGSSSTKSHQGQGKWQSQNYSRGRGRGGSSGRGSFRGRGRGRFDKRNVQCYHCNTYGHFERECRLKEGKNANYAQESGNEKLFSAKDGSFKSKIQLSDDKSLEVAAKGAMELCEKNYKVVFENKTCNIYDKNKGNRVITVVPMTRNGMFPLRFDEHNSNLANMACEDSSWLWHLRYGHLNFQSLKFLTSHALVSSLPKVEEHKEVCEGCAKGKHARERFPKGSSWRAHHPLQLVHSDICGPMQTKSLGKSSYFITFIDDYSRNCGVYFLKAKSEALDTFKKFKALVENERGCKIKCLWNDHGGEFCSKDFQSYCDMNGIRR